MTLPINCKMFLLCLVLIRPVMLLECSVMNEFHVGISFQNEVVCHIHHYYFYMLDRLFCFVCMRHFKLFTYLVWSLVLCMYVCMQNVECQLFWVKQAGLHTFWWPLKAPKSINIIFAYWLFLNKFFFWKHCFHAFLAWTVRMFFRI